MQTKYAGYMGKVMMVDLSTETVSEYPWSDAQRELYLGGKIMAARILCDHLTGKETAFSAASVSAKNTAARTLPCTPRVLSWLPMSPAGPWVRAWAMPFPTGAAAI